MELLYQKAEAGGIGSSASDIRWLSVEDYPIFSAHLEACGQKPLSESRWAEVYREGIVYCGAFAGDIVGDIVEDKMIGRACVEKYSQNAWEIADVRVTKPYRNQEYAYRLCNFVLSYILSQGKIATIRTEEDNFPMRRVIEKLGFQYSGF